MHSYGLLIRRRDSELFTSVSQNTPLEQRAISRAKSDQLRLFYVLLTRTRVWLTNGLAGQIHYCVVHAPGALAWVNKSGSVATSYTRSAYTLQASTLCVQSLSCTIDVLAYLSVCLLVNIPQRARTELHRYQTPHHHHCRRRRSLYSNALCCALDQK